VGGGVGLAIERGLRHRVSASSPTSRVGVSASTADEVEYLFGDVEKNSSDEQSPTESGTITDQQTTEDSTTESTAETDSESSETTGEDDAEYDPTDFM